MSTTTNGKTVAELNALLEKTRDAAVKLSDALVDLDSGSALAYQAHNPESLDAVQGKAGEHLEAVVREAMAAKHRLAVATRNMDMARREIARQLHQARKAEEVVR